MKRRVTMALTLTAVVLGVALVAWWSSQGLDSSTSGESRSIFPLVRPAFAQQGSFLDQEAGIAAYARLGGTITLGSAKQAFKVVEAEESDFLIGIVDVSVSGSPLRTLPHVFFHNDGWLVAYFLKDESLGNAWPWGVLPPDDVLATALNQTSAIAGVSLLSINYYDFEHPTANRLTVVHTGNDCRSFQVQIPTAFQVFEAADNRCNSSKIVYDRTTEVQKGGFQSWQGAFVIVYREP